MTRVTTDLIMLATEATTPIAAVVAAAMRLTPGSVTHDVRVYRAYERAEERIRDHRGRSSTTR